MNARHAWGLRFLDSTPQRSRSEALVARAKAGDAAAQNELFAECAGRIQGWMRKVLDRRLQARMGGSDIAQEAFMAAYAALPQFEYAGPGSFKRWLDQVCRSRLVDAARRHLEAHRRAATLEACQPSSSFRQEFPAPTHSPSGGLVQQENADALQRALAELPADYECVLRLVFFDHMKIKDAAKSMKRSYPATQKLFTRALARLRETAASMGLTA